MSPLAVSAPTWSAEDLDPQFGWATGLLGGKLVTHSQAQDRLARFLATFPDVTNVVLPVVDVEAVPGGFPRVFRAEWLADGYIEHGFIAITRKAWCTRDHLYHATSFRDAVAALDASVERGVGVPAVRTRFATTTVVTRSLVRLLGWCDAGIASWSRQHLSPRYREDGSIPVRVLRGVLEQIPPGARDPYAVMLIDLLHTNPAWKFPTEPSSSS